MSDRRLILTTTEPPESWGFALAKSGKCWWRVIDGLNWAIELSRKLAAEGIHGVIKKVGPARPGKGYRKTDRKNPSYKKFSTGYKTKMAIPEDWSAQLADHLNENFDLFKKDSTTPHHLKASELPTPINPPIKRTPTSSTQEVLRRGSSLNGKRRP